MDKKTHAPTAGTDKADVEERFGAKRMIRLTRLNKSLLILNAHLIEQIQMTPDTVITMTNGSKFVVLEPPDEVVRRTVEYQRDIANRGMRFVELGVGTPEQSEA